MQLVQVRIQLSYNTREEPSVKVVFFVVSVRTNSFIIGLELICVSKRRQKLVPLLENNVFEKLNLSNNVVNIIKVTPLTKHFLK